MIEQTFQHLPGVGASLERRLWRKGYKTWEDLAARLQQVDSIRELFVETRQLELFPRGVKNKKRSRVVDWLVCLDQSRVALKCKQYSYFLERLAPGQHWRLLSAIFDDVLYLDIETTGLSKSLHYVTVIGALFNGELYQWRWPEPLDSLELLLRKATIVVTFNGKRFDIPFLRSHASTLPRPKAHIDLLYVARAAGYKGGQKAIETALELLRPSSLVDVDGEVAVALWCDGLYGNESAYNRLLDYNRTDVEMMPQIAASLCKKMAAIVDDLPASRSANPISITSNALVTKVAAAYQTLQSEWHCRKPRFLMLEPVLFKKTGRIPLIVGIDLRSKEENPTGWALCDGMKTSTKIVYDDKTILEMTLDARPDLVSIDAPLALPRGRICVSDDSPCRMTGGIVRDAERILWARGIRVYPALIRQMQGLTRRGIFLANKLREAGIDVIESYPGAAQDVLGIPRKGLDEKLLQRGLEQFGFDLRGKQSHDELDAVTSALVGFFYLADRYEAIGADDECYMILPRWTSMTWTGRPIRIATTLCYPQNEAAQLADEIANQLGWKRFDLRDQPSNHTSELCDALGAVFTTDCNEDPAASLWAKHFDFWLRISQRETPLDRDQKSHKTILVPCDLPNASLKNRIIREILTTRLVR